MSAKNDAAFMRMFVLVLGGLVAFTLIIVMIAGELGTGVEERLATDPSRQASVAERIAPVGRVVLEGETPPAVQNVSPARGATPPAAMAGAAPDAPAAAAADGKGTYTSACAACHAAGVAGAPKTGDADAWADRIAKGEAVLIENAINGFQGSAGVMPPKGGNASLSDEAVAAAVAYMIAESGGAAAAEPAAAAPAAAPAGEAAAASADGEATYKSACAVCHLAGVAGAPKVGDPAAWSERIAQGRDLLVERAINGFQGSVGVMPPKGGRADLSDESVAAAVDFMVSQSQ